MYRDMHSSHLSALQVRYISLNFPLYLCESRNFMASGYRQSRYILTYSTITHHFITIMFTVAVRSITLQIISSPFSRHCLSLDRMDGLCSVSPTLRGKLLYRYPPDLLSSLQSRIIN